jgi:thiol-disulfide isomerase/thioredoxin
MRYIDRLALVAVVCITCMCATCGPAQAAIRCKEPQTRTQADEKVNDGGPMSFPVVSGIGVALSITPDGPQIAKVMPGSAAARSGQLRNGDFILSIRENNRITDLKGKTMGEVVSLLRGPVGTPVTLELRSQNAEPNFLVKLTREAVPVPGISYANLVGESAPNIQFTKLNQRSHVGLSSYKGKIVVLDIWASWCSACYEPLDRLQQLARARAGWKDRVALLAATIDTDASAALKVIQKRAWNRTVPLALGLDELKTLGIETIPTLLVISPEGKIVAAGDPYSISINVVVNELLSKTASSCRRIDSEGRLARISSRREKPARAPFLHGGNAYTASADRSG